MHVAQIVQHHWGTPIMVKYPSPWGGASSSPYAHYHIDTIYHIWAHWAQLLLQTFSPYNCKNITLQSEITRCIMSRGDILHAAERLSAVMLLSWGMTMQRCVFFISKMAIVQRLIKVEMTHPKVTCPVTVSKQNKQSSSGSPHFTLTCLYSCEHLLY